MASVDTEFVIKLTYAELYNEEIKDLLSQVPNENLKIIDDPQIGPLIQNITEAPFVSAVQVKQLLEEGENRRHFGVTNMNAHSSRSHVIVRLHIEARKIIRHPNSPPPANFQPLRNAWAKDQRPTCISTLNLVDLAGSERANKAGTSGMSLKEGSFINKSLLTLGTVISNLSEGKTQHIPYRNSKLTRLLATALGGNAKTCVITCISPASGNIGESLNTLRFASRAKRIVNIVSKNEVMDMKSLASKLSSQMAENELLKAQLEARYLSPEDENHIENLKESTKQAKKHFKMIKFFMKEGPKIMNKLKAQGEETLAKKFMNDFKQALNNKKNIDEVLEDSCTLIETHMTKDRELIKKINLLASDDVDDEEEEEESGDGNIDGRSSKNEEESIDFFSFIDKGSDKLNERLEAALFDREYIYTFYNEKVNSLTEHFNDCLAKEKNLTNELNQNQKNLLEQHEIIRSIRNNEINLTKKFEENKLQLELKIQNNNEIITNLTNKNNELLANYNDLENNYNNKINEIKNLNAENEKLKEANNKLSLELIQVNELRIEYENETDKKRNEMKIQMERLRTNMSELLHQGGEETKIIQNHNTQLQNEIDKLNDLIRNLNKMKENYEKEINLNNIENNLLNNKIKEKNNEITLLKNELNTNNISLRELRNENFNLLNNLNTAESQANNYYNELINLKSELNNLINNNEISEKKIIESNKLIIENYKIELESKELQISSLTDQLREKDNKLAKFEAIYTQDINKLEKKIAHLNKIHEELVQSSSQSNQAYENMLLKNNDEINKLKNKNNELNEIINSINSYIESNENIIENTNNSIITSTLTPLPPPAPLSSPTSSINLNLNKKYTQEHRSSIFNTDDEEELTPTPNHSILSPSTRSSIIQTNNSTSSTLAPASASTSQTQLFLSHDPSIYSFSLLNVWLHEIIQENNLINIILKEKNKDYNQNLINNKEKLSDISRANEDLLINNKNYNEMIKNYEKKLASNEKIITNTNNKYNQIIKKYYNLEKNEKLLISANEKLLLDYSNEKLLNNKLKNELKQVKLLLNSMNLTSINSSNEFNELNMKYKKLSEQYDLILNEKNSLIEERNTFFNQFTPYVPKNSKSTNPSNSSNSSNSTSSNSTTPVQSNNSSEKIYPSLNLSPSFRNSSPFRSSSLSPTPSNLSISTSFPSSKGTKDNNNSSKLLVSSLNFDDNSSSPINSTPSPSSSLSPTPSLVSSSFSNFASFTQNSLESSTTSLNSSNSVIQNHPIFHSSSLSSPIYTGRQSYRNSSPERANPTSSSLSTSTSVPSTYSPINLNTSTSKFNYSTTSTPSYSSTNILSPRDLLTKRP